LDFLKLKQNPKIPVISEIDKINLLFLLGIKLRKTTPNNIKKGGI